MKKQNFYVFIYDICSSTYKSREEIVVDTVFVVPLRKTLARPKRPIV